MGRIVWGMRGPGRAHSRSEVVVVGRVAPIFFLSFYLLCVDLESPETHILSWIFRESISTSQLLGCSGKCLDFSVCG